MSWYSLSQSFGKEVPHNEELQILTRNLEAQYPGLDLYTFVSKQGYVELSQLNVPKEQRNQGIGHIVVQTIKDFAQKIGFPVVLRPEAEARKKSKLDNFYKDLGFIHNKGRNRDYTLDTPFASSMFWKPEKEQDDELV